MLPDNIAARFRAIVGADHCRYGPLDLELHSYDSSPFIHRPDLVLFPGSAREVARIVALASELLLPLTPRGAGTSLSGGAVARAGGLMVVMTRLKKMMLFDPVEESILVEPGVVNLDLQKSLEAYGYMFPPDPASQKSATIGGNLAENAGGIKGVKYGITKHHVLGLEVVLDDGTLVRTGRLSDSPGPDLTGLFLGSEGTLGLVTKALLKITPLPASYRTVSAVFDDLAKSGRAVAEIIAAGIIPTALEIMDQTLIRALEEYLHLGFPREAQALLLIEVDGLGPELDGQMDHITAICRQAGAASVTLARTPAERELLWLARRSGNGAMGRIKPALIVQDVTVPIRELSGMLRLVQETAARHGLIIIQMAHAGDGNLHPHILYTPGDRDEYDRALLASRDIFIAALAAGGALTGEHGIGLEKIDFMDRQFSPDELSFLSDLKKALDPKGILNPGKVLPPQYQPGAADNPARAQIRAESFTGPGPACPRTVAEAAGLLAGAAAQGRAVIPAGNMSRLNSDPAASEPGVLILSSRAMTEMTVEPENLLATAGAGLTPGRVNRALKEAGFYWPVTGLDHRTLGAIMAEGRPGVETMARGAMIDWVLGLTLVTADGRVVSSGGRTLKNVSGYDFTRLTWQSRGRLAFNAAFILKLLPRPQSAPVLEIETGSWAEAARLARKILTRRLAPEALRLRLSRAAGRVRLLVWLTGFSEVTAAKQSAVANLAGKHRLTVHDDGFGFWSARRPAAEDLAAVEMLGSRHCLIGLANRLDHHGGRVPEAELDLGGGRARLILAEESTKEPDELLAGLRPDVFISSGPVYERLKKTLDPGDILFPQRLGKTVLPFPI